MGLTEVSQALSMNPSMDSMDKAVETAIREYLNKNSPLRKVTTVMHVSNAPVFWYKFSGTAWGVYSDKEVLQVSTAPFIEIDNRIEMGGFTSQLYNKPSVMDQVFRAGGIELLKAEIALYALIKDCPGDTTITAISRDASILRMLDPSNLLETIRFTERMAILRGNTGSPTTFKPLDVETVTEPLPKAIITSRTTIKLLTDLEVPGPRKIHWK